MCATWRASCATVGVEVEVWTVDRGEHLGTTELDGIRVRHLPTPMPARSAGALARFAVAAPGGLAARGARPSAPSGPRCCTCSASDPTACMPLRWLGAQVSLS